MNITQLKSGSYRVRQMANGQVYSFTLDHKPTQKEITVLLAEKFKCAEASKTAMTVNQGIDAYIEAKKNAITVSTIRGYRTYQRNIAEDFLKTKILDVTQHQIQIYASSMLKDHSVKYVKNVIGLIKAVLGLFRPEFQFRVTYPSVSKKDVNEAYMPTTEDVKRIIQASEGTEFEIPLMLAAACGLRRGEICALTIEDLSESNMLSISKDVVLDSNNKWVTKPPKTRTSVRTLYVPDFIADKIRHKGYIYNGCPDSIYHWLQKTQDRLGIPNFTLHKLRHYFCSELSHANIDEATILKLGGWSDPSVMKRVYRHYKSDEAKMVEASRITTTWHT